MTGLPTLAAEFLITVSNWDVWLSIGEALLCCGVALMLGVWVARLVGLLEPDDPVEETLAVGLGCGLVVLAALWAAIWSGGRSSFTPVAVGFLAVLVLAVTNWARTRSAVASRPKGAAPVEGGKSEIRASNRRSTVIAASIGAGFVVATALLFGSTMAPSPRDGVQPVEFLDEAYYAVLGRNLAETGTEENFSPSGFSDLENVPTQTWYHWGELWLASAVIKVFGATPLHARFLIVLPILLLAAAGLTGTLVRRLAETESWRAHLFGFLACLFLAPIPWVSGPVFSSWAVGLIFGITLYGLAAVAALLALYCVAVLGIRRPTWALAGFVGSAVALIVPAHIAIAALAVVGVGGAWTLRIARSLRATRRLPTWSTTWQRVFIVAGVAVLTTMIWGEATGHGLAGSGSIPSSISPFNTTWRESVAFTALGGGAFLAIPVAGWVIRRQALPQLDMYAGTLALLAVGAIGWGARLGDFSMFHVFFGGIAVFATPAAAVAIWTLLRIMRETAHPKLAAGVIVLCGAQLVVCLAYAIPRLQAFGPREHEQVSVEILEAIRRLPPDAKLAYSCQPFDEVAFTDPRLLSIDAHTGRRVVPMCFQSDFFSWLLGAPLSANVPDSSWAWAPQRTLYPDATAVPSAMEVVAFLKANGIDFIYADTSHPNSILASAIPIATSEYGEVLRVP